MDARYEAVLAAVASGTPKRQAARLHGVSRAMLRYLLAKSNAATAIKRRAGTAFSTNQHKRWTPKDDRKLFLLWGSDTLEEVAKALGRTPKTTYWRARKLGLPCGKPQHVEHLSNEARRAGFAPKTLRSILHAASVHERVAVTSRPTNKPKAWRLFDPADVDDAVAAWSKTEVLSAAAKRHGICGATLRSWLVADGHAPPRKKKARWRIESSVIDAVVAKHASIMSIAAHARRLGADRLLLANNLRASGLLKGKRPGGATLLTIAEVDAALATRSPR